MLIQNKKGKRREIVPLTVASIFPSPFAGYKSVRMRIILHISYVIPPISVVRSWPCGADLRALRDKSVRTPQSWFKCVSYRYENTCGLPIWLYTGIRSLRGTSLLLPPKRTKMERLATGFWVWVSLEIFYFFLFIFFFLTALRFFLFCFCFFFYERDRKISHFSAIYGTSLRFSNGCILKEAGK